MSKTEQNLKAAFAGESQAGNKYTYFAKVARKEGYHYIAKIFEETAENERQHAKDEFKLLNGIGDTKANLQAAAHGERLREVFPDRSLLPRRRPASGPPARVHPARHRGFVRPAGHHLRTH